MSSKRKIPETEQEKQELEYFCPSASWGDMTGLIPANPTDEEKRKSYNDVYSYLPEYDA